MNLGNYIFGLSYSHFLAKFSIGQLVLTGTENTLSNTKPNVYFVL